MVFQKTNGDFGKEDLFAACFAATVLGIISVILAGRAIGYFEILIINGITILGFVAYIITEGIHDIYVKYKNRKSYEIRKKVYKGSPFVDDPLMPNDVPKNPEYYRTIFPARVLTITVVIILFPLTMWFGLMILFKPMYDKVFNS